MADPAIEAERRPTHVLRINVPLNLENPAPEDIPGALTEALRAIMAMIRLGTLGLLCGESSVTLEAVDA